LVGKTSVREVGARIGAGWRNGMYRMLGRKETEGKWRKGKGDRKRRDLGSKWENEA